MSGVCVRTISSHLGEVTNITLNTSGRYLLSSSKDNSNRLWDLTTCRPIQRYKGHQNTSKNFVRADFGNNENWVVGGSEDGHVYIWDIDTGNVLQTLRAVTPHPQQFSIRSRGTVVYDAVWNNRTNQLARYVTPTKQTTIQPQSSNQCVCCCECLSLLFAADRFFLFLVLQLFWWRHGSHLVVRQQSATLHHNQPILCNIKTTMISAHHIIYDLITVVFPLITRRINNTKEKTERHRNLPTLSQRSCCWRCLFICLNSMRSGFWQTVSYILCSWPCNRVIWSSNHFDSAA